MNHSLIFSVNSWHLIRNLGAHKIASWLRSHGWDSEVVDYAGFWTEATLRELCDKRISNNTVFVGFGDTWGLGLMSSRKFNNLIDYIRDKYPHVKILVGSQNLSTSHIKADYYIEGYAEHAILEVVKHILGTISTPLKFTFYKNGKLIKGSDYPSIYMSDLSLRYEARDFIKSNEQLGVELSRGCKFQCDFCNYFPLGIRGDNFRHADNYISDLKYLNDTFGITTFYSADSTMNVSPEKLELFGNETAKLNFTPWISGFTRADLMISHKETWDSMIAMGYVGHHYGIETFDHSAGRVVGKGMHPDKMKQGLKDVDSYFSTRSKYRSSISLIFGLPYEKLESIESGIKWIYSELPESHLVVFPLFIPHPKLSDQIQKSLFSDDYAKYGYIDNSPDNNNPVDWFNGLDWVNTGTGLSYTQAKNYTEKNPLIAEKRLNKTPWLIGELMQLSDSTFDQAFSMKFVKNETYTLYKARFDQIIKSYISDKLNYE